MSKSILSLGNRRVVSIGTLVFSWFLLLIDSPGNLFADQGASLSSVEAKVERFCGDCHANPRPDSFEARDWYRKVQRGFEIYAQSGRQDLAVPILADVVDYFKKRAPDAIRFQDLGGVDASWKDRFSQSKLDWRESTGYVLPAISSLQWMDVYGKPRLVVCDMRDGTVSCIDPKKSGMTRQVLARLGHPARVTPAKIGERTHLLVADLGSFAPFDHGFGKVYSLAIHDDASVRSEVMVENCGRIADMAMLPSQSHDPACIVVAEFGHRERGGILSASMPLAHRVQRRNCKILDPRPGCLRILPLDWDKDGQTDFAALLSQQFESVELFLSRGDHFERRVVWTAPDISFGSADLEFCDLNQDGEMDLLLTNGDSFDNNYANASHGVQWLENQGNLKFKYHRLASLPGACRSRTGDIDNDGDVDIVTVAHLPSSVEPAQLRQSDLVSLLMLEQIEGGNFVSRVLERGKPKYPSLEMADFDGNGKLDFAIGSLVFQPSESDPTPRLTFWWQD